MDEQSKATLDAILANDPLALTDDEKAFIRARRSYLTEEQRHVYAEVLAEVQESVGTEQSSEESEAEEQPRTRRGRRTSEESEA